MNIFWLDENLQLCAQYHCDKHVVKMIIEYAQLLSTAHRILDSSSSYEEKSKNNRIVERFFLDDKNLNFSLYKASHIKHPCAIWIREQIGNYSYLYQLFSYLHDEFVYRYGKIHSTFAKLGIILKDGPKNIDQNLDVNYSSIPLCMPDEYKVDSYIQSYRNFYIYGKSKSFNVTWKNREIPEWYLSANL
jgi:hypothetical protein